MKKRIEHRNDCNVKNSYNDNAICTCDYAKRVKASDNRKARNEAYLSCGLVKVKGSLGGTYWE